MVLEERDLTRKPFAALTPGVAAMIATWASLVLLIRLWGVNWDAGAALHPDARHIFNIISDTLRRLAEAREAGMGWAEIVLSSQTSPLNVRASGHFYVYGDLPLTAQTLLAYGLGITGYTELIGFVRSVSAVVYAAAALTVMLLALTLSGRAMVALGAGVVFALAPTVFQIAGFGTVDIWLVAAWAWASLGMVRLISGCGAVAAIWTGLGMAMALSSKLTGVLLVLPAFWVIGVLAAQAPAHALRIAVLGGIAFALGLRVFSAMSLDGVFWPTDAFWADLSELRAVLQNDGFPPNWQWHLGESLGERLWDVALFGIGPAALVGAVLAGASRNATYVLLLTLAVPILALTVFRDIAALRYGAPALAPLSVLAAIGFARLGTPGLIAGVCLALIWGSGIVRLHLQDNARVAASAWLIGKPEGTVIAVESPWDDALPLGLPGFHHHRAGLTLLTLGLETPPDAAKVDRLVEMASQADYIVVSSGRFSEVQPRMPGRFPVSVAWYAGLADGSFCLEPVWRDTPGYPILHWRYDDRHIQEPWTVYDHPPVTIYAPTDCFDGTALRAALQDALASY